jgi:hypothetical protein
MGATAMHQGAGELETLARDGFPAVAAERVAQLHAQWHATRPLLEGWH